MAHADTMGSNSCNMLAKHHWCHQSSSILAADVRLARFLPMNLWAPLRMFAKHAPTILKMLSGNLPLLLLLETRTLYKPALTWSVNPSSWHCNCSMDLRSEQKSQRLNLFSKFFETHWMDAALWPIAVQETCLIIGMNKQPQGCKQTSSDCRIVDCRINDDCRDVDETKICQIWFCCCHEQQTSPLPQCKENCQCCWWMEALISCTDVPKNFFGRSTLIRFCFL